jgi:hypothetical protein
MKSAILIGLVLLTGLLAGCGNEYPTPQEPQWNTCAMWTICDTPERNVYNVSSSDCMTLNSVDSELLWNWLRKYDTTISADCKQQGGVSVKQIPI